MSGIGAIAPMRANLNEPTVFIEPPVGDVSSDSCDVHAESVGVKISAMALEQAYDLKRGGPEGIERWDFLLNGGGEILHFIGGSFTNPDLTDAILSRGGLRRDRQHLDRGIHRLVFDEEDV